MIHSFFSTFYTGLTTLYKNSRYIYIHISIFALTVFLISFVQNYSFITLLFGLPLPFSQKVLLSLYSVYGWYAEILGGYTLISILTASLFFSLVITLLLYYFFTRGRVLVSSGISLGVFFSVLGIGCAACGAGLLLGILSFFGLGGVIGLLPFAGNEFSFVGIVLLVYATYSLCKKIQTPYMC